MSNIRDNVLTVARDCSRTHSVDIDILVKCANSSLGNQLHYGSGVVTDQLIPTKNYVPWLVVDNIHTPKIQNDAEKDLVQFICNEYKV